MTISQLAIAKLYLCAFLLGAALGVIYDFSRVPGILLGADSFLAKRAEALSLPLIGNQPRRKPARLLSVVIFIEDLLFCILAGVAAILLFYELYNGKLRYFAFAFGVFGFLLYRFSLGKGGRFFAEALAFGIQCGIRYLIFFFLWPIRLFRKWAKKALKRVANTARETHRKKQRERYTRLVEGDVESLAAFLAGGGRIKKRKERQNVKRHKKAIQSESAAADLSGRDDRGVARDLYQ